MHCFSEWDFNVYYYYFYILFVNNAPFPIHIVYIQLYPGAKIALWGRVLHFEMISIHNS